MNGMTVKVDGHYLFCMECGSSELTIREDEMITFIFKSKSKDTIVCKSCGKICTEEFILENFELFSSEEILLQIRNKIFRRWNDY